MTAGSGRGTLQLSCAFTCLLAVVGADGVAVSAMSVVIREGGVSTGNSLRLRLRPTRVTSTLHFPRNAKQTPGTVITLDEMKREKGRRGTRTTYRVSTSGFAPDKTYRDCCFRALPFRSRR